MAHKNIGAHNDFQIVGAYPLDQDPDMCYGKTAERSQVESFVDNTPDKNKVILLTTGRLDSWKPDAPEIDAMSSASSMSETASLARSISDEVLDIIELPNNL